MIDTAAAAAAAAVARDFGFAALVDRAFCLVRESAAIADVETRR